MSYGTLTYPELSARFSTIRHAPLGDRRAPHKPLLILLMLGRYQRGNYNALTFEEAQQDLKQLLFDFGPSSSRAANVLDPFWRLQNDGVWRVDDAVGERIAETVTPPTIGLLTAKEARGNFAADIASAGSAAALRFPASARIISGPLPSNTA